MLFKNTQAYQIAFGKKIAHVGGTIDLSDKDLENQAIKDLIENKQLVKVGEAPAVQAVQSAPATVAPVTPTPAAKPVSQPETKKKVDLKKEEATVSEALLSVTVKEMASADTV